MQIDLRATIERIQGEIAARGGAERRVRLMAVTKTQPREAVLAAYQAGLRLFGENRVQEAELKYFDMPDDLELHCLGHLQTNKARAAVGLFRCIQSVDSLHTAQALQKRCEEAGIRIDYLIEINSSGEASKSGYADLELFRRELEGMLELPRLRPRGLMTIGPLGPDAAAVRAAFRATKRLFDETTGRLGSPDFDTLSMGMSGDFGLAVEEGATLVRLGTAIFGARP